MERIEGPVVTADASRGQPLDVALIVRAQAGEVEAFDQLIAGRIDRCYRLAWSILKNEADAADATQDACVSLWRDLPRLREPALFDPWLNRIVVNRARTILRRRGRRVREVELPDEFETPLAAHRGPTDEPLEIRGVADADAMAQAFGRLTEDQRALLVAHHVDGVPLAAIAKALGIPLGTAKSRLHTARRALEVALEAGS